MDASRSENVSRMFSETLREENRTLILEGVSPLRFTVKLLVPLLPTRAHTISIAWMEGT